MYLAFLVYIPIISSKIFAFQRKLCTQVCQKLVHNKPNEKKVTTIVIKWTEREVGQVFNEIYSLAVAVDSYLRPVTEGNVEKHNHHSHSHPKSDISVVATAVVNFP